MRIGLQIPSFTSDAGPAALRQRLAGFASLWVMDHFFQIPLVGPPETDMLEGYTTLAHLAALTRRVKLGTMVTGVTYRHPGVLVKTATTLDVLSEGRAILGIGAAWFDREHHGLGVPFPPLAERFGRLEEAEATAGTDLWLRIRLADGSTVRVVGPGPALAEMAYRSDWVRSPSKQFPGASDYVERMIAFDYDENFRIIAMASLETINRNRNRLWRVLR